MSFSRKRQIIPFILPVCLLVLASFPAHGAASALTLAWDPNAEPDLAGYKVYYGTQSGIYDFVLDAGNVTQYTVTDLERDTRYYFAVTAYDASWNESDFSAEVSAITGGKLSIDFGSGGIWEYDGSTWSRLTASNPEYLAIYDNKLVADFGSGGLWEFDGSSWAKLTSSDADSSGSCLVAVDLE